MTTYAPAQTLTWRKSVAVAADAVASGQAQTEDFVCSTDPKRVDLDALGAALASDLLWWAEPLDRPALEVLIASSVCLGLYHTATDGLPQEPQPMIGFARFVTDRVTFAYLTDVYVLPAYQKRGLGGWMIRCLRELVSGTGGAPSTEGGDNGPLQEWTKLRSIWLLCTTPVAAQMYSKNLGMDLAARYRSTPGVPDSGQFLLEKRGPANAAKHYAARSKDASGWKAS